MWSASPDVVLVIALKTPANRVDECNQDITSTTHHEGYCCCKQENQHLHNAGSLDAPYSREYMAQPDCLSSSQKDLRAYASLQTLIVVLLNSVHWSNCR